MKGKAAGEAAEEPEYLQIKYFRDIMPVFPEGESVFFDRPPRKGELFN